jgi:molybdenum cofactor cytidylyltransferase
VGIVVLAAGGSRRLPDPKQLVRFRGVTLLRLAAHTAVEAACGPAVVVLGSGTKQLRVELAGLDVRVVENPRWEAGMSTSIRAGLDALEAIAAPDAAIFTTCDQPFVTPALLRQLAAAFGAAHLPVAACEYAGTLGVPALFDRSLFGELRELEGDQGAKRVIERHLEAVARIRFEQGAVDVDTPEDVKRLRDAHEP